MRTRLGITVCFVLAVAALLAQNAPPPRPSFRAGTNYVRVDVFPDRNGQPVLDLRKDEFELLDQGVPQTIDQFEHISIAGSVPQDARREPNTVAESRSMLQDARARVFVLFLDVNHVDLTSSRTIGKPLVAMLERLLGVDDLIGVMTPTMSAADVTFARRTIALQNMLARDWWGARDRAVSNSDDPTERQYALCYPVSPAEARQGYTVSTTAREMIDRRREKLTLDALGDLVAFVGDLREERKAVVVITDGWRLFQPNQALAALKPDERPPAIAPVGIDPRTGRVSATPQTGPAVGQTDCDRDRLALSLIDSDQHFREMLALANRANVSFYPVDPRGLAVFDSPIGPDPPLPPREDASRLRNRQLALRTMAEDTDGLAVVNTNNLAAGFQRIVSDLSSYYLLGYYATNVRMDGKFHKITVRVKRPGVSVRARPGYLAPSAAAIAAAANAPATGTTSANTGVSDLVTTALNASAGVNARAEFRLRASTWAGALAGRDGPAAFWIVGELDPRLRRELPWTTGATADVTVLAAEGRNVLTRTIDIPAGDGRFALRVPEAGGVASGEYAVRVRLRPKSNADANVTDTARVVVPQTTSILGEAVLWRRGPSTGPQYLRTADPRFQRNERIRLELPTSSPDAATARLLDRDGKPLPIPLPTSDRPEPSGDLRWIVVDGTLSPLSPGDYVVEVVLKDAKQLTGFKIVP